MGAAWGGHLPQQAAGPGVRCPHTGHSQVPGHWASGGSPALAGGDTSLAGGRPGWTWGRAAQAAEQGGCSWEGHPAGRRPRDQEGPVSCGGSPLPHDLRGKERGVSPGGPTSSPDPTGLPCQGHSADPLPSAPPRPPPLLPTSHSHTPPGSQDTTCPRLAWGVDTAFPPEQHPTLFHAQRSQEGNRGMESLPKTTACQWVRTGLTTQAGGLELCLQVRLPSPGQGPVPPQSTSAPLCRVGQHQPPWLETMTCCGGPGWPRPGAALSLTPEPSEQ